jgi:hypothetical protein
VQAGHLRRHVRAGALMTRRNFYFRAEERPSTGLWPLIAWFCAGGMGVYLCVEGMRLWEWLGG